MAKTRIGERISQAGLNSIKSNRSHELAGFIEKFDALTKTFKPLNAALKNELSSRQKLEKSQDEVSRSIS